MYVECDEPGSKSVFWVSFLLLGGAIRVFLGVMGVDQVGWKDKGEVREKGRVVKDVF